MSCNRFDSFFFLFLRKLLFVSKKFSRSFFFKHRLCFYVIQVQAKYFVHFWAIFHFAISFDKKEIFRLMEIESKREKTSKKQKKRKIFNDNKRKGGLQFSPAQTLKKPYSSRMYQNVDSFMGSVRFEKISKPLLIIWAKVVKFHKFPKDFVDSPGSALQKMKNWLRKKSIDFFYNKNLWEEFYHKISCKRKPNFIHESTFCIEISYGPLIKEAMRFQISKNSIEYIEYRTWNLPDSIDILNSCVLKPHTNSIWETRKMFDFLLFLMMTISIKLRINISAHLRNISIVLNEV